MRHSFLLSILEPNVSGCLVADFFYGLLGLIAIDDVEDQTGGTVPSEAESATCILSVQVLRTRLPAQRPVAPICALYCRKPLPLLSAQLLSSLHTHLHYLKPLYDMH